MVQACTGVPTGSEDNRPAMAIHCNAPRRRTANWAPGNTPSSTADCSAAWRTGEVAIGKTSVMGPGICCCAARRNWDQSRAKDRPDPTDQSAGLDSPSSFSSDAAAASCNASRSSTSNRRSNIRNDARNRSIMSNRCFWSDEMSLCISVSSTLA